MNDRALVVRPLQHWTLHVVLSASGAFVGACLAEWRRPQAVAGMLAGVAVFIGLYTWVSSSQWFQRRVPVGSLRARALLYGTRLRSSLSVMIALAVLLTLLHGPPKFVGTLLVVPFCLGIPDYIAGAVAVGLVSSLGRSAAVRSVRVAVAGHDAHQRAQSWLVGDINSLLPTFLLTLTVGLLLSLLLLILSLACLGFLKLRARWKARRRTNDVPSTALT